MKTYVAFLLLISLFTAACGVKDPKLDRIEASAKVWLHEQDGQTLTFRTAGGQTQTWQVSRQEKVEKNTSGYYVNATPTEHIYLTYRNATPPDSGFTIVVVQNRLDFKLTLKPNFRAFSIGGVTTDDDAGKEAVYPSGSQLLHNYTLGTQTYPTLLSIQGNHYNYTGPNNLDTRYYSKNHGLVGYTTHNGQLWVRQ